MATSQSNSNATNNVLAVSMGTCTPNITASTGNINFNGTGSGTEGTVSFTSAGNGTISAPSLSTGEGYVYANIGTGFANINASTIIGCVEDPNANFTTPASGSVTVIDSTNAQVLTVGNFASTSTITTSNTALNGQVATCANLLAGTTVSMTGGAAGVGSGTGSVTITAGNTVTAGTGATITTPNFIVVVRDRR